MSRKPVFLFVPGAWHPASCFDSLTAILSSKGYEYQYANLASVGATPPVQSTDPDVQIVREATQDLLDAGKNVIVVMHSYGGVIGNEAMKYFVDEEAGTFRPQESGAQVIRMVWIASFILQKGGSLMAALGFKDLPVSENPHNIETAKLTVMASGLRLMYVFCAQSFHVNTSVY